MATHIGSYIKFVPIMLICLLGLSACGGKDQDDCNWIIFGTMPYLCFLPGGTGDSGTGETTPPIAPYNLTLDLLPEGEIDIEWYSNQSISTFWVYRNNVKLAKVSADWWDTVVRTTDDSIEPQTRYCYTVTALDSTGTESANSDEVCVTTHDDVTPPAVPVIFDAISLSTQIHEIGISWEEPNDDFHVSGYKVFRDGNLIADLSELYFSDTGLVGNTQYCYSVIAYDQSLNESVESESACATTSWVITVLDSNAPVPAVELALDTLGQVHIAYSSFQPRIDIRELFYMTNASGSWATEILDHASGTRPSIALGSGDAVHIGQGNKHATNLSGEWSYESIDDAMTIVSLDLDSIGNVHLLYRPQAPTAELDKFNYATNFGGVWNSVSLGETVARYYRLALDNFGAVHIVYYIDSTNELRYMNNSSGGWVTEIVEQGANILWNIAIAIDSSGKSHLSYYDSINRDLKYASNVSNTWVVETIDSQGDVGSGSAIAVADNGTVHISYTDQTDQDLKYVSNASGIWSPAIIDSVNSVKGFTSSWPGYVYPGITSIAVDTTGKVHIAYTGGEYYAAKVLYVSNR